MIDVGNRIRNASFVCLLSVLYGGQNAAFYESSCFMGIEYKD